MNRVMLRPAAQILLSRSAYNHTPAQSTGGRGHVPPSNLNKDPKEQKEDAKRRAEKKEPGNEWQTEKTAIKGDATEASKKAEENKRGQSDRDLQNAKEKLNESTYGDRHESSSQLTGTSHVEDQAQRSSDMPKKVSDQLKGQRPI